MLRKGVYPDEYMDDWEMFNETTLPKNEEFYSNLNMEEIMDADYMHGKRVCNDWNKKFRRYHDLYLKIDALLLVNVFQNFRKMYLKIYEFNSVPGLAWQAALKKTEIELGLVTVIDMLLMVEKELDMEFVMQFIGMQKLITNI